MAGIERFADAAALAEGAAQRFVYLADQAIQERGGFSAALSGGSTPKALYAQLAASPAAARLDWSRIHLFWGDERCVPPDHPDSNYGMVQRALLAQIAIPQVNVHRMRGEEVPDQAALAYEQDLLGYFGVLPPRFDLVLLGLGEDGHTASLFPGTAALAERARAVVANRVEKLNAWRLTLTAGAINQAREIIFLAAGEGKADIIREVINGPYQPDLYPAQGVEPADGRLMWFLDTAAARYL